VLLTIQPVFNMSVNISSTTQTFGSNIPVRTSVTICIGQIMNDGNVASGWQKITPTESAGAGPSKWTLITSGVPARDQFRLLVITTGTAISPSTSAGCITGNYDTIGVTNTPTDLTEGGASSPNHATAETRSLWASIMMPDNLTTGVQQTITLSVQAVVK
jgi:hypothetical protein